jgi:hypothetical protein
MMACAKRGLCLTRKRSRGVDGFLRRVAFRNNKIDGYQRLRAAPSWLLLVKCPALQECSAGQPPVFRTRYAKVW